MEIHQILPSISDGDAIGNCTLEIKSILESLGYKSEIFAHDIHPMLAHIAKPLTRYNKYSSSNNIVIFHFAIGSDVSQFVKMLPDKKILIYHNITPSYFFRGFNDSLSQLVQRGRRELKEFNTITSLALGDSEYNVKELINLGFTNTGVLPIIIDFDKYALKQTQKIMDKFNDAHPNFLFVGRITPNKKQEDIIKTFYYYKKHINPKARLFLVGSYEGMEKYYKQLVHLIEKFDLNDVIITGKVDFKDLLAYYKVADVFISMSEHEGFCVPLLESMYFKIPILAYNSTAIPYTLDGSGVLFNEKRYEEVAEMCNLLISDKSVRGRIINNQNKRLVMFEKPVIEITLIEYIEQVKS
ncbi:MAG: glycosyltransferase family 4 protein [Desulfobacula sp.]|nr:glycosyltransferase family 4 protein [Desulfobacula sp.]